MDSRPIGVFDSGIGGLTVAKEIFRLLPHENIVYFGDTARVPYGTKSPETVIKFCRGDMKFLLKHNVKLVVVACNTASATAIDDLRGRFPHIPLIDVIGPAVRLAKLCTETRKVGVIGTAATISSKAYEKEFAKSDASVKVTGSACPLFVPLAEEGWHKKKVTYTIAAEYLKSLKSKGIDTLILGCTHYPLLEGAIRKIMGRSVSIIDSASVVADECEEVLKEKGLLGGKKKEGRRQFFVSDNPEKFRRVGKMFLGREIGRVGTVDIEKYS